MASRNDPPNDLLLAPLPGRSVRLSVGRAALRSISRSVGRVIAPSTLAVVVFSLALASPRWTMAEEAAKKVQKSEATAGEDTAGEDTGDDSSFRLGRRAGWLFMTGGLALLTSGVTWNFQATQDFQEHDRRYVALCPMGCGISDDDQVLALDDLLGRARHRRNLAIVGYVGGAALATTGLVLLLRDDVAELRPPGRTSLMVMAGAAGAVALGGFLQWRASQGFAAHDSAFAELCADGCPIGSVPPLESDLDSARLQRNLAFVSYGVGAGLLATGLVLAYRDQSATRGDRQVSWRPRIGPRTALMTLEGAF